MNIVKTPLSGLLIIEPRVFSDARGYFYETYQEERYRTYGLPTFVQDNFSRSVRNVLRGLHYQQAPHAQGKLVFVTAGTVWDVAIDIRLSSPTFGQWFSIELSADNHKQLYIPEGFAHGFAVLSDFADFQYKCTAHYQPEAERGIAWNDPNLALPWPVHHPLLSPKDTTYPYLCDTAHDQLFS